MTDDLFTNRAFNDLKSVGLDVTVTEKRVVVKTRTLILDDIKFDLDDVYQTLFECCEDGGSYITDDDMIKVFKKYGIIDSPGSGKWGYGATKGPNYREFMDMVEEKLFSK